ncbi:cytochrome P450 [Amycolatopsis anabasis]|uniref:cytochrome P450 n=1 Tax=Amycolatopsis anabasis TaxID=1840409 RepID=UPI001FE27A58|nr:cytochrome P450 [Amycolatopsis anabasis]
MAYALSMAELLTDPFTALPNLYRRFGPVSAVGAGPLRSVFLLGPEANRFLFANADLFRWREAFEPLVPVDGETALIVSDGADHQRRRKLVQPAFHRAQIAGYVRTMAAEADRVIDGWRPGAEVDLYQEFRRAIRRTTIRVLFGERLAADEPVVGRQLQVALDLLDQNPILQPVRRFLPSYRRAIEARARVESAVRAEIERRRTEDGDGSDVLTLLVHGRGENGSGLSDVEIVDQVISLIAAGYETTSAAMAWQFRALLLDSGHWRRVRDELPGDVSAEDLPRLSYLDGVVNETLRLFPPAAISVRWSAREFSFAGRRIPAGTQILLSPYVTHRLPEIWPDPLRFDPPRWDPDRPGYRKPAPHEFLPFGGGPHRCIGSTFATTELKVMLTRLVRRTSLRLLTTEATPTGLAAMRPKEGVPVRVLGVA